MDRSALIAHGGDDKNSLVASGGKDVATNDGQALKYENKGLAPQKP